MVPIRPRRARVRLRTVLIAALFLASGAAFANLGSTQELPGVVATDLFEQAMQEQIVIPSVDDREQASVPRNFAWIVGLVAVALVIWGFRGTLVRFARPAPEARFPSERPGRHTPWSPTSASPFPRPPGARK